ncbi:MAG: amidophosphoribosyltransferase [Archaeoglobaceae archaeon]|nr:amidophosphoribosyltransferase [Archaeoglobaceae archaeon]MCX8151915.1 amidophosphoribosyltransferase [Archaeoglobaceae archaeon]MDW8013304.1 amidophosphoribosyltransferase [Archaeoglobaceae archaeon]
MCGITAIYCENEELTPSLLYYSLFSLQHRGQESAGISVFKNGTIKTKKGLGLVSEVIKNSDLKNFESKCGIGHIRYSTSGSSSLENAQPFVVKSKVGTVAVAHNGNLVNHLRLRKALEAEGSIFVADSDSEIIAHIFSKSLSRKDVIGSLEVLTNLLIGSYSLVILVNDTVVAYRDPLGFRPLCLGEIENGYVVASESCAIDALEGKFLCDVKPGEAVVIKNGEMEKFKVAESKEEASCVFEYIYFARPDSIIDGISVYDARKNMGEELARESPVEADVVSAIPDSGVTAAIGFSMASKLPYTECLIKNRYVGRTFIMPKQELREVSVRLKVNPIHKNIEGKRIVLVDDSIVRGTTSKKIVDMIKKAGAKEVHMRIASPPIISPCYFGIDMKSREELIAANHSVSEIAKILGVDSLSYLSLDGLLKALKRCGRNKSYCLGCLTAKYPLSWSEDEK